MGPISLLWALAAQDHVPDANSIADILDRGGVGVAALSIVGLVVLFWLYIKQARYYDARLDRVREENKKEHEKRNGEFSTLQRETTEYLKDSAHALGDIARSLDKKDARTEDILRKVDKILDRITPGNHGGS